MTSFTPRDNGRLPPEQSSTADSDPFDPSKYRLSQDFTALLGTKRAVLTVPVRKPDKAWWVRVHPDPAYHLQTAVIELKAERETYLVEPHLWSDLAHEGTFAPRLLCTAINRHRVVFLWPLRLPGPDGKLDDWGQSALEGARLAADRWVRVQANLPLGAYDVWEAPGDIPDPAWPESSFADLLAAAFRNRAIAALDHPVLRRLRGEV